MEQLQTSPEQQRNHLRELGNSPGWKVLKYLLERDLESFRTQLETPPFLAIDTNLKMHDNFIRGEIHRIKWIIQKVEEAVSKKGEQSDAGEKK